MFQKLKFMIINLVKRTLLPVDYYNKFTVISKVMLGIPCICRYTLKPYSLHSMRKPATLSPLVRNVEIGVYGAIWWFLQSTFTWK